MFALRFCVAAAMAMSLAAPVFADAVSGSSGKDGAAGPAVRPAPATGPNEVICRREEVTGSRLAGPRVCHTRQEWAQIQEAQRNGIDTTTARGDILHSYTPHN